MDNLNKWVIVFDLDDTLYSERDYFFSGINAVEEYITRIYKIQFNQKILKAHKDGISDLWSWACKELNLPNEVKETFLWIYRLHNPHILLNEKISSLFSIIKKEKIKLAIITDGRSITQRLKIKALNLQEIPLFISEEFNSTKPSLERFLIVEKKWPDYKYVYVGDNPNKDFIAPKALGWLCIGADWIPNKVHVKSVKESIMPHYWLNDPLEILNLLKSIKTYK